MKDFVINVTCELSQIWDQLKFWLGVEVKGLNLVQTDQHKNTARPSANYNLSIYFRGYKIPESELFKNYVGH